MRASQANHLSSKEPSVSKFWNIFRNFFICSNTGSRSSFVLISEFLLPGIKIQHNQFKFPLFIV